MNQETDFPKRKHSAINNRSDSNVALLTLSGFMVVGVLGIVVYSLQASHFYQAWTVIGIGLMTGGTALLGGGLLGFLFGIPRTLQQDDDDAQKVIGYRANTNLEQISDWLTKILVGVGLTQLAKIPDALKDAADFVTQGVSGFEGIQAFAISVLLFYALCGFLFGFLWTRLIFGGALKTADQAFLGEVRQAKEVVDNFKKQSDLDAHALDLVSRQLSRDMPSVPLESLIAAVKNSSEFARGAIYRQAKTVRSDNWRDNKTIMVLSIPVFEALIAADPNRAEYHGQYGFALKDQHSPDFKKARQELTTAINLRGPWEQHGWLYFEFNRALSNIGLDPEFQNGSPSTDETKNTILADLECFFWNPELRELFLGVPRAVQWLNLNKVNTDALIQEEAMTSQAW